MDKQKFTEKKINYNIYHFWLKRCPLRGGKLATQSAHECLPKPSGSKVQIITIFVAIFSNKIIWKKEKKNYTYLDDREPGERNGSEAVAETIAARRPLMFDEYNLCEMAHRNQFFFLQKQFAY